MKYTEVLISIRQIIRSVNLESKRIEKEYGISIPQLLCLNYLNDQENFQASNKNIKDFLQLNASTVTGIISRLERKGLVARLPKGNDKRVGLVVITAKGEELLQQTPESLHDQLSSRLKQLSPNSLEALQNAFDTIIDLLDLKNVKAAPIITGNLDISKIPDEETNNRNAKAKKVG